MNSKPPVKRIKSLTKILGLFAILYATVSFQNCGQFKSKLLSANLHNESSQETSRIPGTDRIDESCFSNTEFDTCLFYKNPVFQNKAVFDTPLDFTTPLGTTQTFGVKLTGLTSPRLANANISIETINAEPVMIPAGQYKPAATNDTELQVAQLMAYYWANRTFEYIQSWPNAMPTSIQNTQIKIIVDDNFTAYVPKDRTIHLSTTPEGQVMAYDAGIVIHFLGVAFTEIATSGLINAKGLNAHHESCLDQVDQCCTSAQGCSQAIISGIGDYLVAIMFPESPSIGQTWTNSIDGFGFCDYSRNLNSSTQTFNATETYAACEAQGAPGQVNTMGSTYASAWFATRRRIQLENQSPVVDFDRLFFRHLAELRGTDTFSTALEKVIDLDQRITSGKFTARIQSEFQKYGILSK